MTGESLNEQLREMKSTVVARWPEERIAIVEAMLADLEQTHVPFIVDVGDVAPDFTLRNAVTGEEVTLSTALTSGPVVVSFYRGQWCPYCNLEAQGLQKIHREVRDVGGEIFLVGPETEENALKTVAKANASTPVLYDLDGRVMEAYRVAFDAPDRYKEWYRSAGHTLTNANPSTGFRLPIPATFIIGSDQRVAARFVNADYTIRMEPTDVLAAVLEAVKHRV